MGRLKIVSPDPLRDKDPATVECRSASHSLTDRAIRLWPDHERNRQEWLRAVDVVRSTQVGWLLDGHVGRARQ